MEQLIVEETISGILHNIVSRMSAGSTHITDRGLNGKMGMAIFLFHYGCSYNNEACTAMADELIDDIRNSIGEFTSADYYDGLSGVDAGLNYLLKKGFINEGMAELPETAKQVIYNNVRDFPRENIHKNLYRLSGLGKYFAQDYRKNSLITIGPSSKYNRKCVLHFFYLLRLVDPTLMPQLDNKDFIGILDVLSRIFTTGFREKEIRMILPHSFRGLEMVLFNNPRFKPFTTGCNPFSMALSLLQVYERTTDPGFATFAIRLLEEYEGAVDQLFLLNNSTNADLLYHAIACRKLQTVLKEDSFNNYAAACLDFYKRRINKNDNILHNGHHEYGFPGGYAAEGMALLTLEGCIQGDWLYDLLH
ncbi:hypothetical protein A4D02_34835 [Niastella koreensis]|uniref:Lanthionine synthetase C family protein n=2 Tax=Niastella koreensis TaxID=354356 RepID=G8TKI3_NIAKG|nr:hypothetical protein [Niastella koreensis]AEV98657.1 hypothetical protein Niako_2313 [Niastella koreensis GR20-10]OQP44402.1 hypothetical protein A4D02_34835 [Niastella koreensis]